MSFVFALFALLYRGESLRCFLRAAVGVNVLDAVCAIAVLRGNYFPLPVGHRHLRAYSETTFGPSLIRPIVNLRMRVRAYSQVPNRRTVRLGDHVSRCRSITKRAPRGAPDIRSVKCHFSAHVNPPLRSTAHFPKVVVRALRCHQAAPAVASRAHIETDSLLQCAP